MVQINQDKKDFSRRKFLKGGVALSAIVGLSTLTGSKAAEETVQALGKKELDEFPHAISPDYKGYNESRNTFARYYMRDADLWKQLEGLPGYTNSQVENTRAGSTQIDCALEKGSRTIETDFQKQVYVWDKKPIETKYDFASKEDASKAIKKAAKFYGADLVGITPYDKTWVYNPMMKNLHDTDFPFEPKSVIVCAIEMDYEGLSCEPSLLAGASVGLAYSNMVELTAKLSEFVRQLGYNAFASGNDTAQSVPYAIAAGLGEQGRQGILITYEYGPRVRICKVFTEMELAYDKPIKFGANDFCRVCKKCADNCPSQSISHEDNMTWTGEPYTISNDAGVYKYYVNVETCFIYWCKIGTGCNTCISVCPYNKPDFWHHKITTALTATPLKPFLNEMDDLFGYGNTYDEQASINFWDLDSYLK